MKVLFLQHRNELEEKMKNTKLLPSLTIMQQHLKRTLVLKGKRGSGGRYNIETVLHFCLRISFTAHIHVARITPEYWDRNKNLWWSIQFLVWLSGKMTREGHQECRIRIDYWPGWDSKCVNIKKQMYLGIKSISLSSLTGEIRPPVGTFNQRINLKVLQIKASENVMKNR